MKINVRVMPNAKRARILEEGEQLKVYLVEPAVENKANKALIVAIAKHFKVRKSTVSIERGMKSRNKVILINHGQ